MKWIAGLVIILCQSLTAFAEPSADASLVLSCVREVYRTSHTSDITKQNLKTMAYIVEQALTPGADMEKAFLDCHGLFTRVGQSRGTKEGKKALAKIQLDSLQQDLGLRMNDLNVIRGIIDPYENCRQVDVTSFGFIAKAYMQAIECRTSDGLVYHKKEAGGAVLLEMGCAAIGTKAVAGTWYETPENDWAPILKNNSRSSSIIRQLEDSQSAYR